MVIIIHYSLKCKMEITSSGVETEVIYVYAEDPNPVCPCCGGELRYRDSRFRHCKQADGTAKYVRVRRLKCTQCKSHHIELPDFLAPHKQYEVGVITGAIDGTLTKDYVSPDMIRYWKQWFQRNLLNIEGALRRAAVEVLRLGESYLTDTTISLLSAMRENYKDSWLARVLVIIYNSGITLSAAYLRNAPDFPGVSQSSMVGLPHHEGGGETMVVISENSGRGQWQNAEAARRFQLIAPLMQEDLDPAKKVQLRKKIAEDTGISIRTLYRYEGQYRSGGFEGLKPAGKIKNSHPNLPSNYTEILNDAIQLRREVPERSVSQIIFILEQEGKAAPGVLKRPTLERHLLNAGFGSGQLKMYKDDRQTSSKRFCKPHRMMLAQCDIKYGPKLPIGKNGAKVQTYVCSVIDDHSRFVLYSHIYATQDETIVEDTLHKAISLYGKMDLLYCDNGKQFISVQLKYSLSRLGIRVSHAKPRSAKSKGKVEKYQDTINTFIREIELKKIKSLDEANYYWDIYLQQYYLDRSHEGIKEYYESFGVTVPDEGISPKAEFYRDTRPLTFLSEDVVAEAFLHHEKRKVNRGACVKFRGREYETRPELIGYQVDISYDPGAPETITISYPGIEPFTARPVKIGEYCDKNPTLPVAMLDQKPTTSRFLDALERKHNETMEQRADAISFGNYRKDGDENHV